MPAPATAVPAPVWPAPARPGRCLSAAICALLLAGTGTLAVADPLADPAAGMVAVDPIDPEPIPLPAVAPTTAAAEARTCAPGDADCQLDLRRYALCRSNRLLDFYVPGLGPASERDTTEASIEGARLDVSDRERIIIEGDVELQRADQLLRTGRIDYDSASGDYRTEQPLTYQDAGLLLSAQRGSGNLETDTTQLHGVRYQFLHTRGNGEAGQVQILDPDRSRMEQMSFSTCDPDDPDWQLRAASIDIDQSTGTGKARNATLYFRGVPLLYTPWGSFPIDDRRKSGLLLPSISRSRQGGIDITVPYYLNLAPNYDLTLSPRIIGSRGQMLGAEFRYLFGRNHRGRFFGTYMPDDDVHGDSRGYLEYQHHTRFNRNWRANVNIKQVSDDRYFEDFGDSLSLAATTVLPSRAGIYGRGSWWDASAMVEVQKITDPTLPNAREPYRRLPRLRFDAEDGIGLGLVAGIDSELVRFDRSHEPQQGTRSDLYPYLAWPVDRSGWFLRPELGWRQTDYRYDLGDGGGSRSRSRGLPIFSLDSGLIFERDTRLFGRDWLQTLEPRLFYLNVPYQDQSDLPIFDTQRLTFGITQLFQTNRFVGADRQGDANQATLAMTSRLFDGADGRERVSMTLGQIRYFRPQRVQLNPGTEAVDISGSAFVGEFNLALRDNLSLALGSQWNPETDRTDLSSARLQWRFRNHSVINATYRYRRNYLEQVDLSGLWALNERWRLVGRWNVSLGDETNLTGIEQGSSTLEALAGIEFESCCYAIRLLGRHYVRNVEGERDNALYLEIELKGLGNLGRHSGDLLRRAIVGYTRYGD